MRIILNVLLLIALANAARNLTVTWKAGVGWPDGDSSNLRALVGGTSHIDWVYTWGPWSFSQQYADGVEFVPMLWGGDSGHISDFQNAFSSGAFNNAECILGFNEPNNPGQSNLDPGRAASIWKQYLEPLAGRFRLGAPAVSSSSSGKPWLQSFMSSCGGCSISFIPLHWYGSDWQSFTGYVQDMYNTFNLPIWITEFACVDYGGPPCDQNSVYNFMGATTWWLDQQSFVERHAWFGAMKKLPSGIPSTDGLLTSDGQAATGLGGQYMKGGHD